MCHAIIQGSVRFQQHNDAQRSSGNPAGSWNNCHLVYFYIHNVVIFILFFLVKITRNWIKLWMISFFSHSSSVLLHASSCGRCFRFPHLTGVSHLSLSPLSFPAKVEKGYSPLFLSPFLPQLSKHAKWWVTFYMCFTHNCHMKNNFKLWVSFFFLFHCVYGSEHSQNAGARHSILCLNAPCADTGRWLKLLLLLL